MKKHTEKNSIKVPIPEIRNFVAKHAKTSGAGFHTPGKFSRKEKHKTKFVNDD